MPSPRQVARRERIVLTAAMLAADGGLDALQMRDVARSAEVALSTLYRYFPSKTHLVLGVMRRELERLRLELERTPPPGQDAVSRVRDVLARIASTMHASPPAAEAMLQAYLTAGDTAATERDIASEQLREVLALAMWGPEVDARPGDQAVVRVLETLLIGYLASWANQRTPTDQLVGDLDVAAQALVAARQPEDPTVSGASRLDDAPA